MKTIILLLSLLALFNNSCHIKNPECPTKVVGINSEFEDKFVPKNKRFWAILNQELGVIDTLRTVKDFTSADVSEYLAQDENNRTISCPSFSRNTQNYYDLKGNLVFSQVFEYQGNNPNHRLYFYRFEKGYKTYFSSIYYNSSEDRYNIDYVKDTLSTIQIADQKDVKFNGVNYERLVKLWNKEKVDTFYFAEKIGIVGYYIRGDRFNVVEYGNY